MCVCVSVQRNVNSQKNPNYREYLSQPCKREIQFTRQKFTNVKSFRNVDRSFLSPLKKRKTLYESKKRIENPILLSSPQAVHASYKVGPAPNPPGARASSLYVK